jgi:hypothetical protein
MGKGAPLMLAYHWLKADMNAGNGHERAWVLVAAAWAAERAAEIQWQRERFDAIVLPKLTSAARFAAVPS